METTVKQRLIQFLKYSKLSKSEFGRRIGVSSAFVTSIRQSISPEKIQSIAFEFPNLNLAWLLTGQGEMLIDTSSPQVETRYSNNSGHHNIIGENINTNQDNETNNLRAEIEHLKSIISAQTDTIAAQKELISALKQ